MVRIRGKSVALPVVLNRAPWTRMHPSRCPAPPRRRRTRSFSAPAVVALASAGAAFAFACGTGEIQLPEPRRLVVHSGERLAPPKERMEEVDAWVREQWDSIQLDPSFMIYTNPAEGPVYPWETLELSEDGDTASVEVQGGPGTARSYTIYAHYHLMAAQDRLDKWLPEAVGASEFELEKQILSRVADVWVYQRSIFDEPPYGLMDELAYAKENGYLEEFVLTARPGEFVEARKAWSEGEPERAEAFREWFLRVFEREPPGLRGSSPPPPGGTT